MTSRSHARWSTLWRKLVQAARLAVGVPDYDTYVAHMRAHHPGARLMDYAEFFKVCQEKRYGNGRTGCC